MFAGGGTPCWLIGEGYKTLDATKNIYYAKQNQIAFWLQCHADCYC